MAVANKVIIRNPEKLNALDPDKRDIFLNAFNSMPALYEGYAVGVFITSVKGGKHAPRSLHGQGLAVDSNISLKVNGNFENVTTNSIGNCNPNINRTLSNGFVVNVDALYRKLYGGIQSSNKMFRWGGDFDLKGFAAGNYSKYDPMHLDLGGKSWVIGKKSILANSDSDEFEYIVLDTTVTDGMWDTAGTSGTSSSQTGIAQNTSKARLYIGYGLVLSDITPNESGVNYLTNLLNYAEVKDDVKNDLVKLAGIKGEAAYVAYQSNSSLKLSEAESDAIFLKNLSSYVESVSALGFKLQSYPSAISTSIVSYFFGKNTSSQECVSDSVEILKLISNGDYSTLSKFYESKSESLPDDLKKMRLAEANLAKNYNVSSDSSSSSIVSTGSQDSYNSQSTDELYQKYRDNVEEYKKVILNRGVSQNEPASSEYDDTFNDISSETITSLASIMQSQQITNDKLFGGKISEYELRMRIKNFYSTLSRKLNTSTKAIDQLIETNTILQGKSDRTLSDMYEMIPYSTGLDVSIKSNAVKRCELRIRILESQLKSKEIEMMRISMPIDGEWDDILIWFATLPYRMSYDVVATIINIATELFTSVGSLKKQLNLEQGNLIALKHDLRRYNK